MYPRYRGPMVVIRRTRGGSYIIAEMDGTVLKGKVGAFRVIPHVSRYNAIELPDDIHELIDMNNEELTELADREDIDEDQYHGEDFIFDAIPNLRLAAAGDPLMYVPNDALDIEDVELSEPDEIDEGDEVLGLPESTGVRTRSMRKAIISN